MWDGIEPLITCPNFNTPVKDLVYKDLLASTFTQADHDRGFTTWSGKGLRSLRHESVCVREAVFIDIRENCGIIISERTAG